MIGCDLVAYCDNLRYIYIPSTVTFIDSWAFEGSYSLEVIHYGGTVEKWLDVSGMRVGMFRVDSENCTIYCLNGTIDATTGETVYYEHNYIASVTPPTATEDGYTTYTCSKCGDTYTETITPVSFTVMSDNREQIGYTGEDGENLMIPAVFQADDGAWYRVTKIGYRAFMSCTNLVSVTIPAGVQTIDVDAFSGCSNLTAISIPNGVTGIAVAAFQNCTSLTSVTIPDSVTYMEPNIFVWCTSLSSVTLGSGLTKIESGTFGDCIALSSIEIPANVTEIAHNAFQYSGLTTITIPDSVITIGQYAFYQCADLTSITYEGTAAQWNIVTKGYQWNFNVPATHVVCSDGAVCFTHTDVIDVAVSPTCTETGLTEGKHCSVCGEVLVAQETVDTLDHNYESTVTPPTATEDGYTT